MYARYRAGVYGKGNKVHSFKADGQTRYFTTITAAKEAIQAHHDRTTQPHIYWIGGIGSRTGFKNYHYVDGKLKVRKPRED